MHLPVSVCKALISATEFEDWKVILRERVNEHDALHYYLAQIACEVRRSYIKRPNRVKLKQFLLTFKVPKVERKLSGKQRIARSKAAWGSILGVKELKKGKG